MTRTDEYSKMCTLKLYCVMSGEVTCQLVAFREIKNSALHTVFLLSGS